MRRGRARRGGRGDGSRTRVLLRRRAAEGPRPRTAPSAQRAPREGYRARRSVGSPDTAAGAGTTAGRREAAWREHAGGLRERSNRSARVDFPAVSPYLASMAGPDAPPRIVAVSSIRRARRFLPLASPAQVARRLAALERQVEQALGSAKPRATSWAALEQALDRGLDGYGLLRRALAGETTAAEIAEAPLDALYRWWWRVEVIGRERLPRRGPVLVVANRGSSLIPYEALMLARALGREQPDGRVARPLVDEWLLRLPIVGSMLASLGALPATTTGVRSALAGATAIAFPEGTEAVAKPLGRRYRLAPFTRGALLRVAAEAGAPIVPAAVIGAEEVHPVLWRFEGLGRLLEIPALPVTPAPIPLPTKWTVHVGEPLEVPRRAAAGLGRDRRAMRALRIQVRERLQGLVSDGVRRRRGLFV